MANHAFVSRIGRRLTRRSVLVLGATASPWLGLSGASAQALELPPLPTERVIGSPNARVAVIEYHSLTCSNCMRFHTQIFPQIKRAYVDPGRVRFILRDFPIDRVAVEAATLAHCAGPDRYEAFITALYIDKENWAHAPDPLATLRQIGTIGGVSPARFEVCRASQPFVNAILQMRLDGERQFRVSGTPTFVINQQVHRGVLSFEQFARLIDPLLAS